MRRNHPTWSTSSSYFEWNVFLWSEESFKYLLWSLSLNSSECCMYIWRIYFWNEETHFHILTPLLHHLISLFSLANPWSIKVSKNKITFLSLELLYIFILARLFVQHRFVYSSFHLLIFRSSSLCFCCAFFVLYCVVNVFVAEKEKRKIRSIWNGGGMKKKEKHKIILWKTSLYFFTLYFSYFAPRYHHYIFF